MPPTLTLEVDEPKSVVLNTIGHASCLKYLKLKNLKEMTACLSGYSKSGNERLPICVDPAKLLTNTEFREWLQGEIENYAPASTSHVVCMGNFVEELNPLLKSSGATIRKCRIVRIEGTRHHSVVRIFQTTDSDAKSYNLPQVA